MSKIVLSPNNSGTGVFTLEAPATNTDRTLTLPDVGGEIQVSGAPVTFPDGTQQFSTVKNFKNRIINGCFRFWQRSTLQTIAGYGSDDRWFNSHNGSTKTTSLQFFTLGQTEVPGNPRYFSRTVVSSVAGAANFVYKTQAIEGVETFSGRIVVLSFWAKADAAKNISVEFTQYFGSGGSPSALITGIGAQKVLLSTSWQRYSIVVSIPSISGKTKGTAGNDYLSINFWFEAGSDYNARTNTLGHQSGTFDMYGVQLEEGTVATEFEYRDPGIEYILCRRYYQKQVVNVVSYSNAAGTNVLGNVSLTPAMRAAPGVALLQEQIHYSNQNVGVGVNPYSSESNIMVFRLSIGVGMSQFSDYLSATAEL